MKRFVLFLFGIFMCTFAIAENITINWLNEDQTVNQTTTCTVGGDVILPISPTKKGYTFQGWIANYTPIEYLDIFDKDSYIDTNLILKTSDIKIEAKVAMHTLPNRTGVSANWNREVFGIWSSPTLLFIFHNESNGQQLRVSYGGINYMLNKPFYIDTPYTVKCSFYPNKFTCSLNDEQINTQSGLNIGNTNLSETMKLAYCADLRIWYYKIWQDNTLVLDMIPVLDKNGVPCMFDKVEGKFYYNAGTGQFIAGPVVTE